MDPALVDAFARVMLPALGPNGVRRSIRTTPITVTIVS
jgi:hypothetical protein